MRTKPWWALALALVVVSAGAQTRTNGAASPFGQGPGYHDPRSPFKPLEEKAGVLSWSLLSSVTTKVEKKKLVPQFPTEIAALHQQKVKIQGFMMPLVAADQHRNFLLSAQSPSCPFCLPGGPDSLVEVQARAPLRYGEEPMILAGRLQVLRNDPGGLYYRLVDATLVPAK